MKVKALTPHRNGWGEQRAKAVGDSYELPDREADALIASGVVEPVKGGKRQASAEAPGGRHDGEAGISTAGGDSAEG